MPPSRSQSDFIVVGGGSAGCAVAAGLAAREAGRVTLVEAGPSDAHPLVRIPFGLIWLLGSRRDWAYASTPQSGLGGRRIGIPRGRMIGGSGSINSMVWFRGRADDFDGWQVPGWAWADVAPAFGEVEERTRPRTLSTPHPLTRALGRLFGANTETTPTPERESAGVFAFNLRHGRRWSAADAFLRAGPGRRVTVVTGRQVIRLLIEKGRAAGIVLSDGSEMRAVKGVALSAGAIGSPEILLRSGIGPAADLRALGIDPAHDSPEVGGNLHDHPGVGFHFEGGGYGLKPSQWPGWAAAPLRYLVNGDGPLASPTVEGGAFFAGSGEGPPDIQSHFIPFFLAPSGPRYQMRAGYFADACLCRPRSRGRLRLASADPAVRPEIDLGLLTDPRDLEDLTRGALRLREVLDAAPFGARKGRELSPGPQVADAEAMADHIRAHCGTAYHPVGTLRMGGGDAPVSPRLAVNGIDGLWAADASVMPRVTSANTNAPSMMIGHRAATLISEDAA